VQPFLNRVLVDATIEFKNFRVLKEEDLTGLCGWRRAFMHRQKFVSAVETERPIEKLLRVFLIWRESAFSDVFKEDDDCSCYDDFGHRVL
jgi:hypothetical protein